MSERGRELLAHRTHRLGVAVYADSNAAIECSDLDLDGGDADPDVEEWCNEILYSLERADDAAGFASLAAHAFHRAGVEGSEEAVELYCQACDETLVSAAALG